MPRPTRVALLVLIATGLCLGSCSRGAGPGDAVTDVPEEVVTQNNLGTSLLGQQKWGEAADAFRAGLALRPGDPVLLNNVAVALLQQGKPEEAAARLREALAADPEHPHANYNLGLIERNRGEFEAAAAHFAKVVESDPDEVFTQYNLGSTLSRVDRREDAERALRRALELNPTHVSSLYALGRLLVQAGDQDEGIALINRSQEIRSRSGLDEAVGHQYGEQGPYAMGADFPAGGLVAPAPIDVTFDRVAGAEPGSGDAPGAWCVFRLSREAAPVLLAERDGALRAVAGADARVAVDLPAQAEVLALASGDLDGDGTIEVAALAHAPSELSVWLLRMTDATVQWPAGPALRFPGADAAPNARAITLVDKDHDGDLDVFACWDASGTTRCALATNDGAGSFRVDPDGHGVDPGSGAGPLTVAFSDADNDRDVDLLVARGDALRLFSNERDGTFADVSGKAGLGAGMTAAGRLAIADVNKDGWMDLLVGGSGGVAALTNRRGRFTRDAALAAETTGTGSRSIVAFDYDNDGFLDVATARDADGAFALFRNLGAGAWAAVDVVAPDAEPLAALDVDADGDLDVAVRGGGGIAVLANEGGNRRGWLRVEPEGVGDNLFGIGAKVDVLAGALRQKFEVTTPLPLHVGLGERERADAVRFLWPGGVLQDELNQPAGQVALVKQLDRKGTSCPLLYAWRDGDWEFVTDFLGGCAIGYQHAPGVLSTPDTDEYVKIEGGLTERDGLLRLRLNNQLEEVIWFDGVELVVVDHPQGTEVFPNERLMPGPPFPGFELFVSRDVRPVVAARDAGSGRDVTELLQATDRRYVEGFALLPFKGYAELHALDLDLGELPRGERVVLLLDGWIDYADSTANIGAFQAGLGLVPPRLYVAERDGDWREVEGLMGFPAGLPKTMAVDLTDALAGTASRVRIETNMRIYWDRARVMLGGADVTPRVTRLRPQSAELRFGGYPRETSPDGRKPFAYDPRDVLPTTTWKAHAGAYTPFGEVSDLLAEIDDRFVTTRHGDEIELTFASPGPPPAGQTRSYLLYADGFGKDMDPNSAASSDIGPIPFHGMPTYPYGPEVVPPHDPPERIRFQHGRLPGR